MYRRILVPHDGSALAELVLPHAVEIAERFDAEIHLLAVIPLPNPAMLIDTVETPAAVDLAGEAMQETQETLRAEGRAHLKAIADRLTAQGVRTVWSVVDGDPAREIIAYEAENDIDLVAMTTRGRTGIVRAILGSVTERVLREGGRPVLVVRATGK
ncbi:MAG: universal stress protein [Chloroflexi bacterium]|nr:universal stress protein [Chloroflexota bacterium]